MKRRTFLTHSLRIAAGAGALTFVPRHLFASSGERVLVIGAGMAGVATANKLSAFGYNVTVLEGRDRLGGRIWTDHSVGAPVDMGAAWIEGVQGNPLTELASQYGASHVPDDGDYLVFNRRGRRIRRGRMRRANQMYQQVLTGVERRANRLWSEQSVGSLIEAELREFRRERSTRRLIPIVRWIINASITGDIAANPKYLATLYSDDDDGFAGSSNLLPNGYIQLVNGLAGALDIRLNQTVRRISYQGTGVQVATDSEIFEADKVVITLPLGVLKAGAVDFDPILPAEKLGAIERLDMGLLNKVILRFPEAFWHSPNTISGIGNLRQSEDPNGEIGDFVNLTPVVNQPILVGFTGGDYAKWTESLSEQEFVQLAMQTLRRIYGDGIPNPVATSRTKWMSDPYSYGSYSFIPVGAYGGEDRDLLAAPVANRIFFAGEATIRDYPATVHGAYLSGVREADRIIGL